MRHDRHYTLEEAREQLPWVRSALAALRDARARLTDQRGPPGARRRLTDQRRRAPRQAGGGGVRRAPERDRRVRRAAGIVLRDLDSGLIDFPAIRDGQEIYLCWIDGEADIGFWHGLDAGYAGRRPL